MSGKGAITITQDELIKMKMRANLIPSCTTPFTQLIANRTGQPIYIRKARRGLTSGVTT